MFLCSTFFIKNALQISHTLNNKVYMCHKTVKKITYLFFTGRAGVIPHAGVGSDTCLLAKGLIAITVYLASFH